MDYTKQEYLDYVQKKSPNSKLFRNMLFAFVIGGLICTVGQGFGEIYKSVFGLNEESVKTAVPITMVFLGALFTGLNLYHKLAKYAGAGTLVPITGFANAVVSPAIEFKREGYVLGLAAKMFTIAGPVLVYGINASILLGLIYYVLGFGK
ncbi:MAG: stage V sporulation protein AC [Clostridia bacterium]|nr:stage V sporulation protein AC [Clostridia bacterium]MBO5486222.1 stage V sporulation protein AC [Eubacterium sp.]